MPIVFSILFFIAFAVYLFFGIYTVYKNPKGLLNHVFMVLCAALCFWSLGFSMANLAPDLETCLLWRRVSAIGWGSIYSFMLHYILILTKGKRSGRQLIFCCLLYLPAIITVYVFSLSGEMASRHYNLIHTDYGWINTGVQGLWTNFFTIYYISYSVALLIVLWNWRTKSPDMAVRRQAVLIMLSVAIALVLGTITDVVLRSFLDTPLPQMAPIFTLIPIGAIYYSMKKYNLMLEEFAEEDGLILDYKSREKFHVYIAVAYLGGGLLSISSRFFEGMVPGKGSMDDYMFAGIVLITFGLLMLAIQPLRKENTKTWVMIGLMAASVPLLTLRFMDATGITVWVFPIILMIAAMTFNTRNALLLLGGVSIVTQLILWRNLPPEGIIQLDEFDFIIRIGILLIAVWLGTFLNRSYIDRLKENNYQMDFQKLVSEVSFNFLDISEMDMEEKMQMMLRDIGTFFAVDEALICLFDHEEEAVSRIYQWNNLEMLPEKEKTIDVSSESLAWWKKKLQEDRLIYIKDMEEPDNESYAEDGHGMRKEIKSFLALGIEENESPIGFIRMGSISNRSWSDHSIEHLRILSNILSHGLNKIKSEKEIKHMAYYDSLTGLPNRTLFADRLSQAIHLAQRNEKYISIIFMDLDNFKMVNDTMGHNAGDKMLNAISASLVKKLKKKDTVARFGGDEFLILVNDLKDDEDITIVIDKLFKVFEEPFNIEGQEFFISASAGIATYPFDGHDAGSLIKNADIAMYMAKAKGKNQYVLCTTEMQEEIRSNIKLSNGLYRVEERSELILHYQPQIKLQTGEITGVEALLRWNHPQMGMLYPNVFIPLAEMNGTINGIGEWVLKTAMDQKKKWSRIGFPELRIAVNLSIVQLNNPCFADNLERLLREADFNPQYLELEVTESIATKEAFHVVDTLCRLKNIGVTISIDDFGTEYSSLNRLKMLPIDRIKIDMQFIQGIEKSEKDRAITKVVINLAKSLGMEVLAEGVETEPQLDFLNQRMCDEVQGFYYYKPMPAEEFEELLRERSCHNHAQFARTST
ncbi:MAG: EAL domain-containing protein [Anaerovoracaceae bacterium]|jgi:diguanylate cyclase (GGDEF)-like protein